VGRGTEGEGRGKRKNMPSQNGGVAMSTGGRGEKRKPTNQTAVEKVMVTTKINQENPQEPPKKRKMSTLTLSGPKQRGPSVPGGSGWEGEDPREEGRVINRTS